MKKATDPAKVQHGAEKRKKCRNLTNPTLMTSPGGIEPPAFRLGGEPSIQLRYGDLFLFLLQPANTGTLYPHDNLPCRIQYTIFPKVLQDFFRIHSAVSSGGVYPSGYAKAPIFRNRSRWRAWYSSIFSPFIRLMVVSFFRAITVSSPKICTEL